MSGVLRFEGCQHLRQRLVLATLSGRKIRIDNIRADSEEPGLRDFEASLLRLLEKITNDCVVEINETGTTLRYKPGQITGGGGLTHDCPTSRAIGYYVEFLVCLGLFARTPLSIKLRGVTDGPLDPGIDVVKDVTIPLLRVAAGLDDETEGRLALAVLKRGSAPLGGGEVSLTVPVIKGLPPVNMVEEGMVKRIRGVAFSTRVAPAAVSRMVDAARGVLNALLADVFIFKDHRSTADGGLSPGFGLALFAETTTGRRISAEACAPPGGKEGDEVVLPETLGRRAAQALLQEVEQGGVCDSVHQSLLLLLCALGPQELNEVRLGPLAPHAVRTLRHVRDILGVTFSVRPEPDSRTIFLQCVGAGIKNRARGLK